jgi:hypothetical protein
MARIPSFRERLAVRAGAAPITSIDDRLLRDIIVRSRRASWLI